MVTTTTSTLDRRGKAIATFVVFDAAAALESMVEGDRLELLVDDYPPLRADIAAWCASTGHRIVDSGRTSEAVRFLIEKGATRAKDTKLAMVVSADGLEELLTPLGFALAAALEGIEVSLFVQGPAVRVLQRGYRPKLKGWARPFSRFAAAGMAGSGHIPPQEKLAQLRSLGARIYACGPSMEHFKVAPEELAFDDVSMVEYLTFMTIMEDAGIHLYT